MQCNSIIGASSWHMELMELHSNGMSRVNKTKYIGLTVDDEMNWGDQFRPVNGKVASCLASLKRL